MKRPLEPHDPLLPALDDEPGPMPQLSAAEADAIARGAVSRWAARPPGLEPADDDVGPSQPLTPQAAERLARSALRVHTRKQFLPASTLRAAAAALCLSGAVGIAFAAYRIWPRVLEPASQPHAPLPADEQSAADTGASAWPGVERQPTAQLPAAVPEAELPAKAGALAHGATEQGAIEDQTSQSQLPAAMTEAVPAQAAPDTGAAAQTPAESEPLEDPEALLARANALRAKRRWAAAERTYRQVDAAQASEQQRYVALVAAAAIALQHLHSPGRALNFYQSALALTPHGDLDEQALYGAAECYRALDNPAAELKALQRLLTEHATGLLAESAKRRVAVLTAGSEKQP
ncbi:MAG TPA: hypothetical protein VFN67_36825 [Polyangiales bacterium]|jgi:tetratricopeptide (TPR) repeat protein|nr:hypothetical protein [Polyangiales bacterium]